MAARALDTATVSFGLVSIPIKVYSSNATDKGIRFNMLHADCGTRLKQQYICPKHDKPVAKDEVVKGYEFAKGQYVTFSSEELKAAEAQATRSIDIDAFVPLSELDPVFFDTCYYLGPDKGGDRSYRLLHAAMRQTDRCAVAQYAVRGKQYLVMLRPYQDVIVMQQVKYAHEVKDLSEVPKADAEPDERELGLALQLIEQIANEAFDHDRYHDEVKDRIAELVQSKVDGQEVTLAPSEEPAAKVVDLMSALKASLGQEAEEPTKRHPAKRVTRRKGKSGRAKASKPTKAAN